MTPSPTPTDAEKVVAELRALAPKMPEGPWRYEPWHVSEGPPMVYVKEGWLLCGLPADDHAKWIALCSPDRISALLALIESQRATIERVERERDEADAEIGVTESLVADERRLRFAAEARVTALEAEKAGYRTALQDIANQKTVNELCAEFGRDYETNWEGGYEGCIERARQALAQPSTQENDNG